MTPLRKKRLLLLATQPRYHKWIYSQYHGLIREGLVSWFIGYAFLTDKGKEELERLLND